MANEKQARELVDDLEAECSELDALVTSLDLATWKEVTPFLGWTVRDEIVHLDQVDRFGILAMRDPEKFAAEVAAARGKQAQGIELIEQARRATEALSDSEILDRWRTAYRGIVSEFRASEPGRRMPWFGPEMSVVSFITARQMEVWAHGQDIFDMLCISRQPSARIRNICELGVRTHGWSFRNRGLDVPPAPRVELIAPDGSKWSWLAEGEGLVSGSALGFVLVVTQRRHVDDTDLTATTACARKWLEIAQCFAGAPAEGPAHGERGGPMADGAVPNIQ